jgi:hypothetical protein
MNTLITFAQFVLAAIVLVRCVCVAAKISRRNWHGHPFQFAGISAAYALIGGGAGGMALGWHVAPWLLLLGVVLWVLFDRRRQPC